MQRTGVRCIWLTKTRKETKMTPNEIATDISGLKPVENGNLGSGTNFTYTFDRLDDSHSWG